MVMNPVEILETNTKRVICDGGPLGHPRIFLTLATDGQIDCPYCSRRYILNIKLEKTTNPASVT